MEYTISGGVGKSGSGGSPGSSGNAGSVGGGGGSGGVSGVWGFVNVSGGPLSYQYTVSVARLHYGERDLQGSEHTIGNHAFPAEVRNCTLAKQR